MIRKLSLMATAAMIAFAAAPAAHASSYTYTAPQAGSLISPLTGLYVGGYGGYNWSRLQVDALPNAHPDGGDYGGFVGYSITGLLDNSINRLGLGLTGALEGHYGYSNARDSTAGVTTRKRNEWGVDFRPGLTFIDKYTPFGLKPYGIIGYERTKFSAAAAVGSTSEHYNGMNLGFGTEFLAFNHFGVRADYQHVFYKKNNGVDPSENNIRLAGVLHF